MKRFLKVLLVSVMLMPYMVEPLMVSGVDNSVSEMQGSVESSMIMEYLSGIILPETRLANNACHGKKCL